MDGRSASIEGQLCPSAGRLRFLTVDYRAVLALNSNRPTKPFSSSDEAGLKQTPDIVETDPTTGFGHVGIHHQLGLRPILQERSRWLGPSSASVDLGTRGAMA
jgi:hypothetical protein